jgi:hypothetical protein
VDNVTPVSSITIQERRSADGLDTHVPMILRDGALYDPDLDRFFRDLSLNGVLSRHSLRAYGYDVLVWVRFLSEACAKTVWQADRHDVLAYHRVRRCVEAGQRISAASWNRAVACLDRLYRWGVQEGLIAEAPFTHRSVWRQGTLAGERRSQRGTAFMSHYFLEARAHNAGSVLNAISCRLSSPRGGELRPAGGNARMIRNDLSGGELECGGVRVGPWSAR